MHRHAHGHPQQRVPPRQLHGQRHDKGMRRLELAAAKREKEAGAEHAGVAAAAPYHARDGRLARAGHAVEPEDVLQAGAVAVGAAGQAAAAATGSVASADGAVSPGHNIGEQL